MMSLYKDREFLLSVGAGLLMLAASMGAFFYSANYANVKASNAVTDIILSNTRVYDVGDIFVYGVLIMIASTAVIVIMRPRHMPFTLKSIALLYFIRSFAVMLTHISAYPYRAELDAQSYFLTSNFFRAFFTGDDLFFSGHVALPFLVALIFWNSVIVRYIFIAISVIFAVVVLLGHFHYSIDVFSAYFITYSIYVIALRSFSKDFARISSPAA